MTILQENMRLIAESSQQLVRLGEHLWGKGTTEEDVSFDTESEWLKHEITLPEDYIFKDENGNVINATKIVLEKKKKEYPRTYKGCCDTLYRNSRHDECYEACLQGYPMQTFARLLICRDAYWKIAGEEMGLGKPWEPDWNDEYSEFYVIVVRKKDGVLTKDNLRCFAYRYILVFPTKEMRDAFYENFKSEIESCKELL